MLFKELHECDTLSPDESVPIFKIVISADKARHDSQRAFVSMAMNELI